MENVEEIEGKFTQLNVLTEDEIWESFALEPIEEKDILVANDRLEKRFLWKKIVQTP